MISPVSLKDEKTMNSMGYSWIIAQITNRIWTMSFETVNFFLILLTILFIQQLGRQVGFSAYRIL